MKNLKVNETFPNITFFDACVLHNAKTCCKNPYIIEKPYGQIEKINFFSKKYYNEKTYCCLSCKWESEKIITRTI